MSSDELYKKLYKSLPIPVQAIQYIPGNTPKEKHNWIRNTALKPWNTLENPDIIPFLVLSMLIVENAIKQKRHRVITSTLLTNNLILVNQALKATWFFNGSQEIINVAYFSKHIFPHLSHRMMKVYVVRTFARCIKNPSFAQAIFNALRKEYFQYPTGIENVLQLLIICDKEFIYETVVQEKLILPVKIFKKIYYKNPEFGVQLIKEYIGHYERYTFCARQSIWKKKVATITPTDIIQEYKHILHTLAKKRSLEFVDIVQNVIKSEFLISKIGVLSKICAEKFLKKAKNTVIEYSYLYMPILPSEVVNTELLEMMFPSFMRYHCRESFSTDKMLNYLKDFPEDKKFEMFSKTYRNLYQHELLDKWENVTLALLKILPIEKRIECAQEKIRSSTSKHVEPHATNWTCFLSVHEALQIFKDLMKSAETQQSKLYLIWKMLYTCNVNKDEAEMYNVLSYAINEKLIINDCVTDKETEKALDMIFSACGVPFVNERNGSLLCDIIQLFYTQFNYVYVKAVTSMMEFRLIKNMPITDLMDMLIDNACTINLDTFQSIPRYKRKCLTCLIEKVIKVYTYFKQEHENEGEIEHKRETEQWIWNLEVCLEQSVALMYNFNERLYKEHKRTQVKPIRITDFPILMDFINQRQFQLDKFNWRRNKTKAILRRHEPNLYRSWYMPRSSNRNIADVTSIEAFRLLKNNYQSILDNWEEYLTECKKYRHNKHVKRFIKATLWYKDIPIKFGICCIMALKYKKEPKEIVSALNILNIFRK